MEFGRSKSLSHVKTPAFTEVFTWLGWRDSNPRMLGPEPSALPLGDTLIYAVRLYHCLGFEFIYLRIRATFRGPVATSMQTSLQELAPLRIATGNSATVLLALKCESAAAPPQLDDIRQSGFRSCELPLAILTPNAGAPPVGG